MRAAASLAELTVELDGRSLAAEAASALTEVRVQQALSVPTLCEVSFPDVQGGLGSGSYVPAGAPLRLTLANFSEPLFDGEVTAVEYVYEASRGRVVRVRGYDRLHRLRKRQPVRAHVQVTVADLARDLVRDLDVSVQASDDGPLRQRLIQYRQSDLELLAEAAERCGLYFILREDGLHLLTLEGIGDELVLELGDSLLEARLEVNGDPACRSVAATGWDPLRGEPHQGWATAARLGRSVPVEVPPEKFGGSGERRLVDESIQDDRQAEALAQAELDARVAREVTFWGVAEGDPRLRPGARVEVRGVAEAVAGRYVLTAVAHTIDTARGFISEVTSLPAHPRPRPRATILSTATVTRVEDPEALGRVQVALPAYEGVETEWMGVVMPGAGSGKGLVMVPDVGDQVLVLFPREDPAQGVILGGLYGPNAPPDAGVEQGRVRRFTFLTPGGQRMALDDVGARVRLENAGGSSLELGPERATLHAAVVRLENVGGSSLELGPDRVTLHAAVDLTIEAPGRAIRIRARSIDFEQA